MKKTKVEQAQWILLILFTAVFALVNLARTGLDDLWLDEVFTVRIIGQSIKDMLIMTAKDVHPPLYYFIVRIITDIFGKNYMVFRAVSFIPFMITCIYLLLYVKKNKEYITGFLFLFFISFTPNAVLYNNQIRMYGFAALFCWLAYIELDHIIKSNDVKSRRNYLLFTLFSVAAAYTHYYALITVGFFFLGLLIFSICKKNNIKLAIICSCTAALAYTPWLIVLLQTMLRLTSKGFWIPYIPSVSTCIKFLLPFSSKYYKLIFVLVFAYSLFYSASKRKKEDGEKFSLDYSALIGIMSAVMTVVVGEVASYILFPCFLDRYIYPAAVVFWWITSKKIGELKLKYIPNWLFCLFCVIFMIISNIKPFLYVIKEDYRLNQEFWKAKAYIEGYNPETTFIYTDQHILATEYYFPKYQSSNIGDDCLMEDKTQGRAIFILANQTIDQIIENNDQTIDILKTEDGVYQTKPVKIYVTEIE